MTEPSTLLWLDRDGCALTGGRVGGGEFACVVRKAPTRAAEEACQDVAAAVSWAGHAVALLVADGVGGGRDGDVAARLVATGVTGRLAAVAADGAAMRSAVLGGIEEANASLLARHSGAATTVLVAILEGRALRSCHAGDSELLVVGQRGKIKHQTVSHSPVGYGVEAGLIPAEEGLEHEDRHLLSSCVGMQGMRVEVASAIALDTLDTLVLASDGLWDNLFVKEVAEIVRKGPLARAADVLAATADRRMRGEDRAVAGKPDDLAVLLYRPR